MLTRVMRYYKKNLVSISQYLKNHSTEIARLNLIAADLTRNTHSIEKGLSIDKPRPGFGHQKQKEMIKQLNLLSISESAYHQEVCAMAVDAFLEYLNYHKAIGYTDDFMPEIEMVVGQYKTFWGKPPKGGTLKLEKADLKFDIPEIEKFFKTRHSIRDFSDSDVNEADLLAALNLAKRAPSACNRQGIRAYVINPEQNERFVDQLSGIGGFEKAVKKFIIITGKISAYRLDEDSQYIVSASMYAAYLTLTLHLYGMGACVVQRPVIWNKEGEENKEFFSIPSDEQIICLIAVGNLKDSCVVPLSHRLENSEMIRFL